MMKYRYVLLLGSNLGDRLFYLREGLTLFLKMSQSELLFQSKILETKPWPPGTQQPLYLNQAVDIQTFWTPDILYDRFIRPAEDSMGRDRKEKWSSRSLDIDIALWAHNDHKAFALCSPLSWHKNFVTVPHSQLKYREFAKTLLWDIGVFYGNRREFSSRFCAGRSK